MVKHWEKLNQQQREALAVYKLATRSADRDMLLVCENELRCLSFHVFKALNSKTPEEEKKQQLLKAKAHAVRSEYDACEACLITCLRKVQRIHDKLGKNYYLLSEYMPNHEEHHANLIAAQLYYTAMRNESKEEFIKTSQIHIRNLKQYVEACYSPSCQADIRNVSGREKAWNRLQWLACIILPLIITIFS